mgnify:CR=1 FL=1
MFFFFYKITILSYESSITTANLELTDAQADFASDHVFEL